MCPASIRQASGVSASDQAGSTASESPVLLSRSMVWPRTSGVFQGMPSKDRRDRSSGAHKMVTAAGRRAKHEITAFETQERRDHDGRIERGRV